MSDALRAASVASSTAIPMSAFFNAGASFTPSPVMPQMCFISWSFLTISYLCSGNTPANPSAFSISSSTGMLATFASLSSPSREVEGYMLVPIPNRRPVSLGIWRAESPIDHLHTAQVAMAIGIPPDEKNQPGCQIPSSIPPCAELVLLRFKFVVQNKRNQINCFWCLSTLLVLSQPESNQKVEPEYTSSPGCFVTGKVTPRGRAEEQRDGEGAAR
nr:hypothetical protein CRG98_026008 [Ipomoea batatas]